MFLDPGFIFSPDLLIFHVHVAYSSLKRWTLISNKIVGRKSFSCCFVGLCYLVSSLHFYLEGSQLLPKGAHMRRYPEPRAATPPLGHRAGVMCSRASVLCAACPCAHLLAGYGSPAKHPLKASPRTLTCQLPEGRDSSLSSTTVASLPAVVSGRQGEPSDVFLV